MKLYEKEKFLETNLFYVLRNNCVINVLLR